MSSPIILFGRLPAPGEPTEAQKRSGRYRKRRFTWQGLTLAVENEAGTYRRGVSEDGTPWETLLMWAYGYVCRSEGVDGDEVDVYLGPQLEDAPMVYVVHQRRYGDWSEYDEDKAMLGFMSEGEARDAFLACYDDPRFLGPITAMPVAEFVRKVKATKEAPAMIKSKNPVVLLLKAHVRGYTRRDGTVVKPYDDGRPTRKPKPKAEAEAPLLAFGAKKPSEEKKPQAAGEFHGRQAEMNGHLEKHGWRLATAADEKTHPGYAYSADKERRLEEGYASGQIRRSPFKEDPGKTLHYVHPDRPDEVIEISPAEKPKAGPDYSVWTHHRQIGAKPASGGFQSLGGRRGQSGRVEELAAHLASGKAPS